MDRILYLVPIGEVEEDILTLLCHRLQDELRTPCDTVPPLPHPSYAYNRTRQQYLSSSILHHLRRLNLPRAHRVLGVTDLDLYVPDLNFVFGQATMRGKDAVIALPRLRQSFYGLPADPILFQERALKEAVHELGHTLGLAHCPDARCVMHFSNSLQDTDIKSHSFCPDCRARLEEQARSGPGHEESSVP